MLDFLKIFGLLAILSFFGNTAFGQLFVEVATSNKYPGVGDKFKLTYSLKMRSGSLQYNGIEVKKPTFDNFNVVDESTGRPGFSFGGGFGEAMTIYEYQVILQPKQKGTFSIDPLTFKINKETYSSGIFTVQVGEGDPQAKFETKNADVFARIDVSKNSAHQGESIFVTYKIYSRYQGVSLEEYKPSSIDGAWTEEIKPGKDGWPTERKVIGGKAYLEFTLKKEVIYPQKTGELVIPSFDIVLRVGRSIFDAGKEFNATSNTAKIQVNSLPNPSPLNFSNQVGENYKMEVSYSTSSLKSNEPIDLKIKISGKGNLKQLMPPKIEVPHDFELYDPEIEENIKLSTSGYSGSKTFKYLLIPRHHGDFEIPPITFNYFNLTSKTYQTLSHPAHSISVSKGNESSNISVVPSGMSKEEVQLLAHEIRHIESKTILYNKNKLVYNQFYYWFILLASPFLLIAMGIAKKWLSKEKDHVAHARKHASKNALKQLQMAENLLEKGNDKGFYEELHKSLLAYFGKKFGLGVNQLTIESLSEVLSLKKVDPVLIADLGKILQNCEMARFAPVTHKAAQDTLIAGKNIINLIDSHVKK